MELTEIIAALRARWWPPAAGLVIGLVAAIAFTVLSTPAYTSQTRFFVSTTGSTTTSDALQGSEFSQRRAASYAELLRGTLLPARVIDRLDLSTTPEALSSQISVTAVPETVLIDVAVQGGSPEEAQRIATVLGEEFIGRVRELESVDSAAGVPVRVSVAELPTLPGVPTSPRPLFVLGAASVAGLAVGAAGALVRSRLDRSLKNADAASSVVGVPVIGQIRRDGLIEKNHTFEGDRLGPVAEDYRRLGTNLRYLRVDEPPVVIMVSSTLRDEGKSATIVNLALALADAGRRVTIVDADLRRPKLAEYLGLVEGVGLTNVLTGAAEVSDVIQRYGDKEIWTLPAGPTPPNPGELLGSASMAAVVKKLRTENDFVLVDAPPLLPVADSSALAVHMDGVLMAVRHGRIRREDLARAAAALDQVGAQTLGLVFTMVPRGAEGVAKGYPYSG